MSGWPTMEEVEQAPVRRLLSLNRFSPSPRTLEERRICGRVLERLVEARRDRPREVIAASRDLGW